MDVLLIIGACELHRQRPDPALTLLTEALRLIRASGYRLMLGNVLTGLGAASARLGHVRPAALFLGAASSHREETGVTVTGRLLRDVVDGELQRVRAALGDAAFTGLYEAGRSLLDPAELIAVLEDADM